MPKKKIAEISKSKSGPQYLVDLRERAEKKFKAADAQAEKELNPEEMRLILHELRVHQIELEMQNEELRLAQVALETARARYFDLYDLAPVGYVTVSETGLIEETNLTAATMLGAIRGELVRHPISRFISKEHQDTYYRYRKQLFATKEAQAFDLLMVKKDGTEFWAYLAAIAAPDTAGAVMCRIVIRDISERKQAESDKMAALEALQRAFQENRDQFSELQHRTKNSFALILGMISLKANADISPPTKSILADLDARIRSIAELHSLLYAGGTFAAVRLDEYCARIAGSLVKLAGNVTLHSELEAITIPFKDVVPLGLILTELLTNAVKHAFPGNRRGTIVIALKKSPGGAVLEVRDDGGGLPPGFALSENTGKGLNLVQAFAKQINGGFRIESSATGTRCIVEFALTGN